MSGLRIEGSGVRIPSAPLSKPQVRVLIIFFGWPFKIFCHSVVTGIWREPMTSSVSRRILRHPLAQRPYDGMSAPEPSGSGIRRDGMTSLTWLTFRIAGLENRMFSAVVCEPLPDPLRRAWSRPAECPSCGHSPAACRTAPGRPAQADLSMVSTAVTEAEGASEVLVAMARAFTAVYGPRPSIARLATYRPRVCRGKPLLGRRPETGRRRSFAHEPVCVS